MKYDLTATVTADEKNVVLVKRIKGALLGGGSIENIRLAAEIRNQIKGGWKKCAIKCTETHLISDMDLMGRKKLEPDNPNYLDVLKETRYLYAPSENEVIDSFDQLPADIDIEAGVMYLHDMLPVLLTEMDVKERWAAPQRCVNGVELFGKWAMKEIVVVSEDEYNKLIKEGATLLNKKMYYKSLDISESMDELDIIDLCAIIKDNLFGQCFRERMSADEISDKISMNEIKIPYYECATEIGEVMKAIYGGKTGHELLVSLANENTEAAEEMIARVTN